MKCFASAEITSDSYELVITHHLTNGLQDQYICVSCNKRLYHVRPTLECSMCSRKFTELYFKFREQGIDMCQSIFRVDIFSNTNRRIYIECLRQSSCVHILWDTVTHRMKQLLQLLIVSMLTCIAAKAHETGNDPRNLKGFLYDILREQLIRLFFVEDFDL